MQSQACSGEVGRKGWASLKSHTIICPDHLIVLHIREWAVKVVEQAAPSLVIQVIRESPGCGPLEFPR